MTGVAGVFGCGGSMDGGWMTMQRGLGGRERGGQEAEVLPTGRWPVVRGPLTLSSGPDQPSKGCDSPTRGRPKSQRRGLRGGEHSGSVASDR